MLDAVDDRRGRRLLDDLSAAPPPAAAPPPLPEPDGRREELPFDADEALHMAIIEASGEPEQ